MKEYISIMLHEVASAYITCQAKDYEQSWLIAVTMDITMETVTEVISMTGSRMYVSSKQRHKNVLDMHKAKASLFIYQ